MTGWQLYRRVRIKLSQLGFTLAPLSPDKLLEILVDQMFEINGRTTLAVAHVSFPTAANQRRYRLQEYASMGYLNIIKILRASYDGNPVWPERPWQFDGDTETGTTPTQGTPGNIWIETETYAPGGVYPVSEKCVGVFPMPDKAYTIRMVCRVPVPAYTNMNAELPIRSDAHEAILTNVMAELFAGKDFHDNAMKALWEQKRQLAERELFGWEARMVLEHPPEISSRHLVQVE